MAFISQSWSGDCSVNLPAAFIFPAWLSLIWQTFMTFLQQSSYLLLGIIPLLRLCLEVGLAYGFGMLSLKSHKKVEKTLLFEFCCSYVYYKYYLVIHLHWSSILEMRLVWLNFTTSVYYYIAANPRGKLWSCFLTLAFISNVLMMILNAKINKLLSVFHTS